MTIDQVVIRGLTDMGQLSRAERELAAADARLADWRSQGRLKDGAAKYLDLQAADWTGSGPS